MFLPRNHDRRGNFFTDERRFGFQRRVVIFASVIAAVRVCFSTIESFKDIRRFRPDLSSAPDGSVFVPVVFFRLFIYLFFAAVIDVFSTPLCALAIAFRAKWPEIGRKAFKMKFIQIDRPIGLRRIIGKTTILAYRRAIYLIFIYRFCTMKKTKYVLKNVS